MGLSPRARGILIQMVTRAYPRGRGETMNSGGSWLSGLGLSPRARGNRGVVRAGSRVHGPIPAGAGKPQPLEIGWQRVGAYPRGRGETGQACLTVAGSPGLSPRARGNQRATCERHGYWGPIPAGAGKPKVSKFLADVDGAYPRGRGETSRNCSSLMADWGLSPRARGNPAQRADEPPPPGPIPAGAGKPSILSGNAAVSKAYPRGRGETSCR